MVFSQKVREYSCAIIFCEIIERLAQVVATDHSWGSCMGKSMYLNSWTLIISYRELIKLRTSWVLVNRWGQKYSQYEFLLASFATSCSPCQAASRWHARFISSSILAFHLESLRELMVLLMAGLSNPEVSAEAIPTTYLIWYEGNSSKKWDGKVISVESSVLLDSYDSKELIPGKEVSIPGEIEENCWMEGGNCRFSCCTIE